MTELSFVSNLYRNVLFREPDTAGTNFWVNQLTLGGASRATVTAAFINSAEADTFVNPIIRLYENILGRAPDAAGLYSWSQALRSGQTLQQITAGFLNSAEGAAAGWSGAGVTGNAFITKLYTAMGRTPAQIAADPSVASWAQALNSGAISPANVAIGINESAENRAATAGFTAGYEALRAAGITQPSTAQAYTFLNTATTANIIASAATVTDNATLPTGPGVVPPVTGEGYLLTSGTDVATANVFTANQVFTPAGNARVNALQDEDNLTGTGTNPTLNATLGNAGDNGGTIITPKLNGIETIKASFTGSGNVAAGLSNGAVTALDLQDATGVKNISIERVSQAINNARIENIKQVVDTLSINNTNANNTGTVEFSFGSGVLKGANTGTLNVNNVQVGTVNIGNNTSGVTGTGVGGQGYETLTLNSNGTAANSIGTLNLPMDTGTTGKVTITGSANLTLASTTSVTNAVTGTIESVNYGGGIAQANGRLASIDASAFTGNLTLNIGAGQLTAGKADTSGVSQDVSIIGGSGADTFILGDTVETGDTISGGAGVDKLIIVNGGLVNSVSGALSSIEQVEVRLNATAAAVDFDKIADATSILVHNESNTANAPSAGVASYTLNNLTVGQAAAITVQHSDTGSNGIAQNLITANLKVATGTTDTVSLTIAEGLNTDPRFNATLTTNAVENITIVDADTESNTLALASVASHTGTITLGTAAGAGKAGTFLNLDTTTGGANGGLYQYATTGATDLNSSNAGATVGRIIDQSGNAAQVRIGAATINAAAELSDVVVRVGTNAASAVGAQSITMGAGNDTVIFDNLGDNRAGLTISDTVVGGAGNDTLAIDGNVAITLGASEWTNVSGFETIRLIGNGVAANNAAGATNSYNLTLTNALLAANKDSTGYLKIVSDNDLFNDTGRTVAAAAAATVTNADGTVTAVANDAALSSNGATIDARTLSAGSKWSFNGNEGAGRSADRIILSDANIDGNAVIDGGAIDNITNNSGIASLNGTTIVGNATIANAGNDDVIEIRNAAVVSTGDLANIKNIGTLSFTNDQSVTQVSTLQLNDDIVDNLVDSYQASASRAATATTTGGGANVEVLRINGVDNTNLAAATTGLTLEAGTLTDKSDLSILLGRGVNTIATGAGQDSVTLLGGYTDGTYAAVINGININTLATATGASRAVTDTINLGAGIDTLTTYGAINLVGATLTGVETITAHSALVISAAQYRTLIANAAAAGVSGPVITFSGNTTHQLRIVGDAGAALDLSKVSLGASSGANGSLVIDTTDANGAAMGNAPTGTIVDNSTTGDAVTGTVSTSPTNNTILTSATSTFLAGETKTGTAGVNDTFQGTYAALTGTTITGTDADTETLTLTTAAGAIGGGGAAGTITNIDALILGNFANTVTFGAGTGIKSVTGGTGVDTITTANMTAGGTISTGAGADVVTLSALLAGTTIDLGADNDTLSITGLTIPSTMTLSGGAGTGDILSASGTVSISAASVSGFEVLDLSTHTGADVVTMTLAQNNAFTSLTNEDPGDGITLTTAGTVTALADDGGNTNVVYNLSGTGANIFNASSTATKYIVTGGTGVANTFNFGTTLDANDTITGSTATDIVNVTGSATLSANVTNVETINFTTSTAAQTLTTGAFATNAAGTTITAAASTVAVTINAAGVTSTNALTIIDGAGNDTINVSTTVASRATEVVTLSTGGSDTVVINDLVHAAAGQTGVTINNFTTGVGAAADVLRLQFDATASQANFLGDYTVVTAAAQAATVVNSTTTLTVFEVNQAAASTTSLTDVANGGLVETALATAFGTVTNAGGFEAAVILYGTGAAAGNAGLYSVVFTDAADAGTANMTVELIGVLNGVTADSFVSSNIA